jgi:hypothetical protein
MTERVIFVIVKWMVCKVLPHERDKFSLAQVEWIALKEVNGFIGQIGGWDLIENNCACILALWEDLDTYNHFMKKAHDEIFLKFKQNKYYESISVTLYECFFNIQGINRHFYDSLHTGKFMSVTDVTIHDSFKENFIKVQKDMWNSGNGTDSGLYSGVLSDTLENKFLISILWKDQLSHQKYIENNIQIFRDKPNPENALKSIINRLIILEPKWNVI